MKNKVIVHIGMHKTGSSSIQKALFTQLKDPAFQYADLGGANRGGTIYSLFSSSPETSFAHRKRGWGMDEIERYNAGKREKVVQAFQACKAPTVILSGEAISKLAKADLIRFRGFLLKFFADITVVGYVRPPGSFMESAFQQRVKGSMGRLKIDTLYPGYRQTFKKFDLVFGRKNVHLWKFDPKSFLHGDVVRDFCRRLGIDMRLEEVKRVNEALSKKALALLFTYRKFGSGYGVGPKAIRENLNLIKALQTIPGDKLRFAHDFMRPVLDANRDDIEWMEKRLSASLKEDFAADFEAAIRSEDDLLRYEPESLEWLAAQLGPEYESQWQVDMAPETVAAWVHTLRQKVATRGEGRSRKGASPRPGSKDNQEAGAQDSGVKAIPVAPVAPEVVRQLPDNNESPKCVQPKTTLREICKIARQVLSGTWRKFLSR